MAMGALTSVVVAVVVVSLLLSAAGVVCSEVSFLSSLQTER